MAQRAGGVIPRRRPRTAQPRSPSLAILPAIARYTWRRHVPAELLLGLTVGVTELAGFVSQRSLGAPRWVVPVLIVAVQVPWLLAPGWEVLLARGRPARAFLWLGLVQCLPLLLIAAVDPGAAGSFGLWLFLCAVGWFQLMHGAYLPQRGGLLRANYPERLRGRIYAGLSVASMLAVLVSQKGWGFALDANASWLRVAFPLAGVTGLLGYVLLARIRWRYEVPAATAPHASLREAARAVAHAWRDASRVLRRDHGFRTFELGFMLYGLGLLGGTPLLVLFAEGPLGLSYSQWATARGVVFPLALAASMFPAGRLTDQIGPVRVGAVSFALLAVFFAVLPLAEGAWSLWACFALMGLAMSGVNASWALGPLHFAPRGQGRRYTSVHVSLVGMRSGVGPLLAFGVAELSSLPVAFALCAALVAAGAFVLARSRATQLPR